MQALDMCLSIFIVAPENGECLVVHQVTGGGVLVMPSSSIVVIWERRPMMSNTTTFLLLGSNVVTVLHPFPWIASLSIMEGKFKSRSWRFG